jgi:hypothetical protein
MRGHAREHGAGKLGILELAVVGRVESSRVLMHLWVVRSMVNFARSGVISHLLARIKWSTGLRLRVGKTAMFAARVSRDAIITCDCKMVWKLGSSVRSAVGAVVVVMIELIKKPCPLSETELATMCP